MLIRWARTTKPVTAIRQPGAMHEPAVITRIGKTGWRADLQRGVRLSRRRAVQHIE
jgi:hypothetical protein